MTSFPNTTRYLIQPPPPHLRRPPTRLQPILARPGKPSVDLERLRNVLSGVAEIPEIISVQSPDHWSELITGLDHTVDAILPLSNPAYPTEIWNAHPHPILERGIPLLFWSLLEHDEPDFWRYAARDFLRALGAEVHMVNNSREGLSLVKALAMRRFLRSSKFVLFGEQNFPWNAAAGGHLVTHSLGVRFVFRPVEDFRSRYPRYSDEQVNQVIRDRLSERYTLGTVRPEDLRQAVRTYLAIRDILEEEKAFGFGVNCFGDLVVRGGRDVPCLAQLLLREEGYIAACDGDYITMTSMALASYTLDKPCMMSNLYPVSYVGALTDHFGDPLSPSTKYPQDSWSNLARLAHCGFVGVVSPEMTPSGKTALQDWGGTYEIKRDGRGCGVDGELVPDQNITIMSLVFDAKRMMIASGRVAETTRHPNMPHCESSALLEIHNLPEFFENVSRDHVVVVYGDHVRDYEILATTLGLEAHVF